MQEVNLWWHAAFVGWLKSADIVGATLDQEKWTLFRDFVTNCTWSLITDDKIYVSRRPVKVHWQDRRLHNEAGKSVEFADGTGWYSINGVKVDEQIVMAPETQTIDQILKEKNEEVKRIRIDRYGWDRFLEESHAKCIDSRRNDIEGTLEALYEIDGIRALACVCPSTAKVFCLEVDPECDSCEAAQSYLSSGLSERIISAS